MLRERVLERLPLPLLVRVSIELVDIDVEDLIGRARCRHGRGIRLHHLAHSNCVALPCGHVHEQILHRPGSAPEFGIERGTRHRFRGEIVQDVVQALKLAIDHGKRRMILHGGGRRHRSLPAGEKTIVRNHRWSGKERPPGSIGPCPRLARRPGPAPPRSPRSPRLPPPPGSRCSPRAPIPPSRRRSREGERPRGSWPGLRRRFPSTNSPRMWLPACLPSWYSQPPPRSCTRCGTPGAGHSVSGACSSWACCCTSSRWLLPCSCRVTSTATRSMDEWCRSTVRTLS